MIFLFLLAEGGLCWCCTVHLCDVVTGPQATPTSQQWQRPMARTSRLGCAEQCNTGVQPTYSVQTQPLRARGSLEIRAAVVGGTEAAWFASAPG